MKRCVLLALLLCLVLAGCMPAQSDVPAAPEQAAASTAPDKTAEEPLPQAEPAKQAETEPEEEPVLLEAGPEVLLFGVTSPTLCTEDGTLLVRAAQFAEGGRLSLQEEADAVVLSRLDERLRLPTDGAQAIRQDGEVWLDGALAAEQFGLIAAVTEDGTKYFARPQNTEPPTENVNVPILMYHAVGDETWGYSDLFVRPSELENHLQYLADSGYETIFFDDLSHLEAYEKPVLLTFDDGYDDNYTELYPLLKKYQAKATIFVIPRDLGKAHKMTAEQIQELAQSGLVSIQSHTWSHGNLSCMDEETLIFEMEHSRDAIAALTGQVPSVVCYPEGTRSELSVAVARRYYQYGLLMNGYIWNTSDDPFYVTRMYIPRGQWSIQWNVEKAGTHDAWR